MSKVHIERLHELYAMVAGIPAERINLSAWRRNPVRGALRVSDGEMLNDCGTLGCAVGWACAYPPFKRQGLGWANSNPTFKDAMGNVWENWNAVEEFFGVQHDMARYLFSDTCCDYPGSAPERYAFRRIHNEKLLLLARIRTRLLLVGGITQARYEELARQEARGKLTP